MSMLTITEITERLIPILQQYNIKEAILFGSYAKGCADEGSDIDLYVDSGLRGLKFFELLEDVVTTFPIPIDLVDRQMVTSGGPLEKEIFSTGKVIKIC